MLTPASLRVTEQRPISYTEQNACLANLQPAALALLKPHMSDHVAAAGTLLWEPNGHATWAYFPTSGLISVVVPTSDGAAVEVANIGRESAACGSFERSLTEVATAGLVCISGTFKKIASDKLFAAAERNKDIADLIDRCRPWTYTQAQHIAACNTLHAAEKRLARWLLVCGEKLDTTYVPVTQETIAGLLGIRRTTLSLIAQTLCTRGLIEYRRGKIKITDVGKLKAAACECCDHIGRRRWPLAAIGAL